MAIDAVQAIHSSPVVQNIEAIDNAQRNPNPQSQGSAVPQDKVTISRAAQAQQAASAGDKDHDGDSK
jgi:hypothetical protein